MQFTSRTERASGRVMKAHDARGIGFVVYSSVVLALCGCGGSNETPGAVAANGAGGGGGADASSPGAGGASNPGNGGAGPTKPKPPLQRDPCVAAGTCQPGV